MLENSPIVSASAYVRTAMSRLRQRLECRAAPGAGFLFAAAYAAVATVLACGLFPHVLMSRLNDFFLLGIVLTAYWFMWRPAVGLLAVSLAVSAWVNGSPLGLASFGVVSLLLVLVLTRLQNSQLRLQHVIAYRTISGDSGMGD
jgi:hypothetical protein